MNNYKSYLVCAMCIRNGNIETLQTRIITESPEAAKEGAIKFWKSKGLEPFFLGTEFDVIEESNSSY